MHDFILTVILVCGIFHILASFWLLYRFLCLLCVGDWNLGNLWVFLWISLPLHYLDRHLCLSINFSIYFDLLYLSRCFFLCVFNIRENLWDSRAFPFSHYHYRHLSSCYSVFTLTLWWIFAAFLVFYFYVCKYLLFKRTFNRLVMGKDARERENGEISANKV